MISAGRRAVHVVRLAGVCQASNTTLTTTTTTTTRVLHRLRKSNTPPLLPSPLASSCTGADSSPPPHHHHHHLLHQAVCRKLTTTAATPHHHHHQGVYRQLITTTATTPHHHHHHQGVYRQLNTTTAATPLHHHHHHQGVYRQLTTTAATTPHHHHHHQSVCRPFTTTTTTLAPPHQPGRLKRFIKKMGWLDHSQSKLKRSGFILYESACGNTLTSEFFQVCDLPDTFFSFFLVLEIHVWMLMARLMAEGEEGRFVRNAMVEAMWQDCEQRSKKLGAATLSVRQEQIQSLGSSFQAALFSYDEGLLTSDRVLASALWRRLFSQECGDPERLECVLHFIRRQMAQLDTMSRDELLLEAKVTWLPLLEKDSHHTPSIRNFRSLL